MRDTEGAGSILARHHADLGHDVILLIPSRASRTKSPWSTERLHAATAAHVPHDNETNSSKQQRVPKHL